MNGADGDDAVAIAWFFAMAELLTRS